MRTSSSSWRTGPSPSRVPTRSCWQLGACTRSSTRASSPRPDSPDLISRGGAWQEHWEPTRRAYPGQTATLLALAPLLPQHHRGGACHVHDLAAAAPSRFAAAGIGELRVQHRVFLLSGRQPSLQLDDALDAREVHALLVGEPLDLQQLGDILPGVASPAAAG